MICSCSAGAIRISCLIFTYSTEIRAYTSGDAHSHHWGDFSMLDLKFSSDGVVVTVRKSKTDQEGAGREVGLPFGSSTDTCPVRALRQWLHPGATTHSAELRSRRVAARG